MNEKELISRALNDRESYAEIVNLYYKEISNYIYKRTFDKEVAKDLTQETFLRALKYLPSFKGKSSFIFWLLRIATNVINAYYRKEIKNNKLLKKSQETYSEEQNSFPDDTVDYKFIYEYVNELPPREQTVITLVFFEHKNIKDVALIIGRAVSTTKKIYYNALKNLKKEMKKNGTNF